MLGQAADSLRGFSSHLCPSTLSPSSNPFYDLGKRSGSQTTCSQAPGERDRRLAGYGLRRASLDGASGGHAESSSSPSFDRRAPQLRAPPSPWKGTQVGLWPKGVGTGDEVVKVGGAWVSCPIRRNSSLPELTWALLWGGEEGGPSAKLQLAPRVCACVCSACVCECECARAEAFLRLRCLETEGAIGEAAGWGWGWGLPDPRSRRGAGGEASPQTRLLTRAKAGRGRRCGRPQGPGGPAREELGRRPELHGVSRARNSGGASATGLRGAARQPRTWAEPARRGSARPAGAGGVEERAVPGVRGTRPQTGAEDKDREERARIALRANEGLVPAPARAWGAAPGRRGSRQQRGCRRGDAAAGWGCEREAERCPPAPPSAPPPPCGPRRKPPALRGGASEPGLRSSGPARPAPAQREVSAAARSLPPLASRPRLLPPSSPLRTAPEPRGCRGPLSLEWAGSRPTTPPIPVGTGKGQRAGWRPPEPPSPPLGAAPGWPPARGRGAGEGPRGVPLGCPGTVRAACRLGAAHRAPGAGGRGRPGGGREGRRGEWEPHRSPGGRAGRLPGLREAESHGDQERREAGFPPPPALLGARSWPPPARGPRAVGSAG